MFTPNIQLEEPARGDYVGTWDTPVNNNMTLVDLVVGGNTTISGAAGSVVLSGAQFQAAMITINSTLLSNIAITFPTSFIKSYKIRNVCTGSSAFFITLGTTAAATQLICPPPGEIIDVVSDGVSLHYTSLPHVGTYWDYVGGSVPTWVSGCTIPPWLAATGATFASSTFPQLAAILGSTTLPDSRGRSRFALDGGTGRISSAATGFSGSSVGASGGSQATTLSSQNVPPVPITDPGHNHTALQPTQSRNDGTSTLSLFAFATSQNTSTAVTGISAGNAVPTAFTNLPPAYVGGIVMIRAG
jgi:microcystin-dependent protein